MTTEIEQLMSLLRVLHEMNTSTDMDVSLNTDKSTDVLSANASNTSKSKSKSIYPTHSKLNTTRSRTSVPSEVFTNTKLTAKLSTQLHDPLTVVSRCMPPWCDLVVRECPFLFPFELRRTYFFTTGLAPQQSFKYLVKHEEEQAGKTNTKSSQRSSLPSDRTNKAIKLEVNRDMTCLQGAIVAMEEYARRAHDLAVVPTLEVRFINEVGTGEGPTREFCNLIALHLQRKDLQLWRHENQMEEEEEEKEVEKEDLNNVATGSVAASATEAVSTETMAVTATAAATSTATAAASSTTSTTTSSTTTTSPYVNSPYGLFPAPSINVHAHMGGGMEGETSPFDSLYSTYIFLGRMFAFALVSDRTVDLSLSAPLRRAILQPTNQQEEAMKGNVDVNDDADADADENEDASDVFNTSNASNISNTQVYEALHILDDVDPAMCRHLTTFQKISETYIELFNNKQIINPNHPSLCIQGAPIEMLCLDFTLPGNDEFPLIKNGANVSVTLENVGQYVKCICNTMVLLPLKNCAQGIRQGMSSMFDPNHLRCFDEDEFELLLCGTPAVWTSQELHEHIRTDHGFSKDSIAVQQLLNILASFNSEEQKQFLKFVTGSPRLPVGGLSALRPSLTVVRKSDGVSSSSSSSSGGKGVVHSSLPSASTCTSYLKLPEYKTENEMREKLLLAISEGQGAFHLS